MTSQAGFMLYADQYEPIAGMTLEQKGILLDAMFAYLSGQPYEISDPVVKMAFGFFKAGFDRAQQKYANVCAKRKDAINSRWNGKEAESDDTKEAKGEQADTNDTNEYKPIQTIPYQELKQEQEQENLKTHPLPLAIEGNGDAVSNSPRGSREDGTNPRALGSNPRSLGTNPRAQDENPRALGSNPRTTRSQVSKTESAAQIDAYTESPELRESLKAFVESRRALRKPLTAHALGLAFSQLDKLASDDATKIAVVDQSVLNGWQGFFELKTNNARASPPVQHKSWAEMEEERCRAEYLRLTRNVANG